MYCISELDFNPKSVLYVAHALPAREVQGVSEVGYKKAKFFGRLLERSGAWPAAS